MPTDSEQVGNAALARWNDVAAALSPIIGARGVVALFRRSLYLRQAEFPFLAVARATVPMIDVFAAFRAALLRHASPLMDPAVQDTPP